MKKKGTVRPLTIDKKNCHKYYPLIKREVADNFIVKPYINCSIAWNISKCISTILLQWRSNCHLPFSRKQGVNRKRLIPGHLKSLHQNRGLHSAFLDSTAATQGWCECEASTSQGVWAPDEETTLLCSLKGKSHRSLLPHFDNTTIHSTGNWYLKTKKLHLSTEDILQLWIFFAIMHIAKS